MFRSSSELTNLDHMKLLFISTAALLLCASCVTPNQPPPPTAAKLLPELQPYADQVAAELHLLPTARKPVLDAIAALAHGSTPRLNANKPAYLAFIGTDNARRSHMSQIWAQAAAHDDGLEYVQAYSGGTEVTACNCRTIAAMRRAGFNVEDATA